MEIETIGKTVGDSFHRLNLKGLVYHISGAAWILSASLVLGTSGQLWAQQTERDLVQKGLYLFAVAGGCACHTIPDDTPHAGGRSFPIPFGDVFATNITQERETGIGGWSDQEILDSLVKGIKPNGDRLLPVMPYEAYSGMAQEDLHALIAYLRNLEPVKRQNRLLKSSFPFFRPLTTPVWLKLYGRSYTSPKKAPTAGVSRGKYLVDHVAICGDCHTPRNILGAPRKKLYLAGAADGPLGEFVPNITPDEETGIGDWSREQIAELLLRGIKPDFDNVQGLMAEVIEGTPLGYRNMKREDALAIADYLKSIPPIKNKLE